MRWHRQVALLLLPIVVPAAPVLSATPAAAAACDRPANWTSARKIAGKTWTAWWQANPAAIPVGAHFSVRFHLCGPAVRRVNVRGWMPDHQHGMNYRPSVALKGNRGTAEGLLFHMPGKWQLILNVRGSDRREKLTATFVLD